MMIVWDGYFYTLKRIDTTPYVLPASRLQQEIFWGYPVGLFFHTLMAHNLKKETS